MKLTYTLTEQSFIDYNLYNTQHAPSQQKAVKRMRLLLPVVWMALLAFYYAITISMNFVNWTVMAVGIILSVLWYLFYPAYHRRLLAKQMKVLLSDGRNRKWTDTYTLELLDDRLRETGPGRLTEVSYDKVEKVGQDEKNVYIYIGMMLGVVVPLSAFADDDEKRRFFKKFEVSAGVQP